MGTSRALLLAGMLAVQPICAFAGGTVLPPDPVGEQAYRAYLRAEMFPITIIACASLLAMWLARKAQHRAKKLEPDQTKAQHC